MSKGSSRRAARPTACGARSQGGSRPWPIRRPARAPSSGFTSRAAFYRGPYKDNAPDLIVGYRRGYRVSWEAAIGKTTRAVFQPNTKAWSGDHCVDPVARARHPVLQSPDR